jgi:hypothetical protein
LGHEAELAVDRERFEFFEAAVARELPALRKGGAAEVTQRCTKVANRDGRDFGWEIAHGAVTRRPADSPLHDGTLIRGLHERRRGLGFFYRSRTIAPCQTFALRFELLHRCNSTHLPHGGGFQQRLREPLLVSHPKPLTSRFATCLHHMPGFPSRGGLPGLAGVTTRPAGYPSGGVPPAVERPLHLHHTPSRVPQRRGTTSCREAAPLTPHAQPGTPAVEYHQLSRGRSTYTTRPAGYPSGGVPPAVERPLYLHHTPSRVPQRWSTTSCREAAPLTPHAQPGTPAAGYHQRQLQLLTYFPALQVTLEVRRQRSALDRRGDALSWQRRGVEERERELRRVVEHTRREQGAPLIRP